MSDTKSPHFSKTLLVFALAATCLPAAMAQPAPGGQSTMVRVAAGVVVQGETDLDAGGAFDHTRYFVSADYLRPLGGDASLDFSLGAAEDQYGFANTEAPWDDVTTLSASMAYTRRLANGWTLRIAPTVESSRADGASVSEGVVAGLVGSGTRTFRPDLTLGFGFAGFSGLEETRVFPIVVVRWEISDTWTLQNPFRPGPAGPAGLELVWSSGDWELGFGGAYRSNRFKLEDSGETEGGIGESNGVPLFLRASRALGASWDVDLYAGMLVAGSLEVEDARGREVSKSDFDPAPVVALTVTGRF